MSAEEASQFLLLTKKTFYNFGVRCQCCFVIAINTHFTKLYFSLEITIIDVCVNLHNIKHVEF